MTLTIELSPEAESALTLIAAARGANVSEVARSLLESQMRAPATHMTAQERADAWRASARDLPLTPPLSDDAISRASLYE